MSLKKLGIINLLTGLLAVPGLCDTAIPGTMSNESVAVTWDANTPLSDYLAYAALHNPGLEAAFNHWQAALAKVAQARSLPDPKLTYRYFIHAWAPNDRPLNWARCFPGSANWIWPVT